MAIVVGAVFMKITNIIPKFFMRIWILNKIKMLYYERIEVSEGNHDKKQANQKNMICDIC